MNEYKVVALLPMKAHSDRVKAKNFRNFNGKPLFRWLLDTMLSIQTIENIVINTDARKILSENGLTESERILIRDRKPELCGDFVSMNLILEDDIQHVKSDTYIMTHTTNPLLRAETIVQALRVYKDKLLQGYDSIFSVDKFQTRFYRADGSPVNHDPDNLIRTQDLEPFYAENSNLYIFSSESFASTKARIGKKPFLLETPRLESSDIDDKIDWQKAEAISKYLATEDKGLSN